MIKKWHGKVNGGFRMGKVIDFKSSKNKQSNIDSDKEADTDIDERIFFETNTECEDFEEFWEM